MPGGVDIRNLLGSILNVVKSRANQICAATCDGLVLRMHYRWTFFVLLGGFLTTWYSWYHRDVITCVSHFNAETQVRLDYINICLSYPYVEGEEGGRRYLLFYRWVSWSMLLLAGIFYIPRKLSKNFDNKRCKKLLEDLAANAHVYDEKEALLVKKVTWYMYFNIRTHDGLYWKYLSVNVVALVVDIFAMHYFDFILQGRFIQYGFESYPFHRDPQKFTDYMSQTFPPFVSCELSSVNQLVNRRTEKFGCHLTIMELYEKLFLALWLWLITLTLLTCCYIVFLCLLWLPWVRILLLRFSKPVHGTDKGFQVINGVLRNSRIGDIYLLYRFRQHFSHARFYDIMVKLADPDVYKKNNSKGDEGKPLTNHKPPPPPPHDHHLDCPKPRKADVTLQPTQDPEYLYKLLGSPEILGRTSQNSLNAPVKRNTSILIE